MYRRAKWAKDRGLNWQAVIVEECETELKLLLKDAVLTRKPWTVVNSEVTKAVDKAVAEMESETLKQKARSSLLRFASVEYRRLKSSTRYLNIALIGAVATLLSKLSAVKEKNAAIAKIKGSVPSLRRVETEGQYWERAVPLREWTKDYHKRVEDALQTLVNSSAKDDYGSNVSLRNIAEMTVRYERNMSELEEKKQKGVKLVWISTHGNCSKRCEPWQGRLYSLDGTSGTIDGNKYIPIETAMNVPYVTKSGKTYQNGILSGYNCRHRTIEYEKGNKPFEIPSEVIAKERELERRQRSYERVIRDKKTEAEIFKETSPERAKAARKEARRLNAEYKAFSMKNNIPWDPERTKIFEKEAELKAEKLTKK